MRSWHHRITPPLPCAETHHLSPDLCLRDDVIHDDVHHGTRRKGQGVGQQRLGHRHGDSAQQAGCRLHHAAELAVPVEAELPVKRGGRVAGPWGTGTPEPWFRQESGAATAHDPQLGNDEIRETGEEHGTLGEPRNRLAHSNRSTGKSTV